MFIGHLSSGEQSAEHDFGAFQFAYILKDKNLHLARPTRCCGRGTRNLGGVTQCQCVVMQPVLGHDGHVGEPAPAPIRVE